MKNESLSFWSGRRLLFAAVVSLAPLSAAQAVSPLGFEIPEGRGVTTASMSQEMEPNRPHGPSPLGFEIPVPGPRGAAGPMRQDSEQVGSFDAKVRSALAGIGGERTN